MGVKSLWSLLKPAGRPVMLETVEGKSMAIDSSIWIYQFQATMRDKDGRALVNAHVLGFLRRICKLLFYGIKPVFVFDGGAPALKRMTISERKKKKSGASESHAKIAEKLLAAQMRREALKHVEGSYGRGNKSKIPNGPVRLDEDTVYLEDIDGSGLPVTPKKDKPETQESPSSSAKKTRWRDYDPYRLPEVDMDAAVAKVTRSNAPDPRLATEDELRAFIDMMTPEDFDVNSSAFRELPTEVQYEIIGDLRIKSRQTSHKRLQAMLKSSKTPLDFSKAQILNLKQRNALTQQVLVTNDNIGKAHIYIPVRMASERNKEYMLVKNEGPEGGWVLGITDFGTEEKPIEIDQDEHVNDQESDENDDDMEEVTIESAATTIYDPDLREYQRERALEGVARRQTAAAAKGRPKALPSRTRIQKSQPLFLSDEKSDKEDTNDIASEDDLEEIENDQVTAAMQASLEDLEVQQLRRAMEESRKISSESKQQVHTPGRVGPSGSRQLLKESSSETEDDLYTHYTPSRLDAALRFANTSRGHEDGTQITPPKASDSNLRRSTSRPARFDLITQPKTNVDASDEDDDLEEVSVPSRPILAKSDLPKTPEIRRIRIQEVVEPTTTLRQSHIEETNELQLVIEEDSDDDMEEVVPVTTAFQSTPHVAKEGTDPTTLPSQAEIMNTTETAKSSPNTPQSNLQESHLTYSPAPTPSLISTNEIPVESNASDNLLGLTEDSIPLFLPSNSAEIIHRNDESDSDEEEAWPKSPFGDSAADAEGAARNEDEFDAANEMDVDEEEGEFARFSAQVKGKDLDSVRREIDEEIRQLHQQRKVAMRDSDDVTQTMVAQIMAMLRLFGIPYITAPMEAEAQCASLVELGLVDGIITDDSDVFLFGGLRVFKNMFNQSKTVECFLLADLQRELGLDRSTLIQLAYLLGSDYTEGLTGVGPVAAMELLREFPGDDGLHKFREWWQKVQSGRDIDVDNKTTFKKRFKKRFKDLYLTNDWPNTAVRDAYLHPVVDTSDEPFKWALPDLDRLRDFFRQELSWNAEKVDELLLPIIHKMNRRGQEAAANRQSTLNDFLGVISGVGPAEPRKRQAYASKRLQVLVTEHKKAQKQKANTAGPSRSPSVAGEAGEDESNASSSKKPATKKRKKAPAAADDGGESKARKTSKGKVSMRSGKDRGGKASSLRKKPAKVNEDDASNSENEFAPDGGVSAEPTREMALRSRVRPRPAYKGAVTAEKADPEASGSDGSEYHE